MPARAAWRAGPLVRAGLGARDRATVGAGGELVYRLFWNPNSIWLACTERDDAPDRVVWRNPHGHPVAWNHLDAEAAHAAAQLCEHFVAGITLHAVKTATVNRHDCALHVNQIVLAQSASNPFPSILDCDTEDSWSSSHLGIWSFLPRPRFTAEPSANDQMTR